MIATSNPKAVTFPALVAHDESRERYLEIEPDQEGIAKISSVPEIKEILEERRERIWGTRTRLHFSTDTQYNANALIACITTRESIGGRAWPSFVLHDKRYEKAVAIWFNSTLGIMTYWWISTKSQHGRGSVTTTRLEDLLCFDPRTLSDSELKDVDAFFENFKFKSLMDIHESVNDVSRSELDRFVVKHFLRAGELEEELLQGLQVLKAKLCLEPSISDD